MKIVANLMNIHLTQDLLRRQLWDIQQCNVLDMQSFLPIYKVDLRHARLSIPFFVLEVEGIHIQVPEGVDVLPGV